ncbi:peptidoglycan-binding protein [Microbulbifer sp. JMSA004]|uniref:peptidoglycan-binding protein n=1 Tax=unclassified Microbulbifer TaxID=2619833 RepID=UPI0024AD287C|nr:peptidoglycan-binding protein [Microbulbifer sp. VAAF005]WHI47559.1 peptidoglycan-binding protein [Microbulbifer sp. VAAF005]
MARMPGAIREREYGKVPMTRHDIVCLHTIVGFAPAHAAHFSTKADGTIIQSRDTDYRSAANRSGNYRVIAVENEDHGPAFGDWNVDDGHAVPAFTEQQIEAIAKICVWAHKTHDIPLVECPNSKPGSRGIAYHRQGIDGNWSGYDYSGRISGGEKWSNAGGKVCPGDRRISQIPQIIARAIQIAGGADKEKDKESYLSGWKELLKTASQKTTLKRARSCLERKTRYKLGKGGINPLNPLVAECDCSGFVAWSIGVPRELPPGSAKWLQTSSYWEGGGEVGDDLFALVTSAQAQPGDLYVYPDHGRKQGHMGIITEVKGGEPTSVIHCSSGNNKIHGDAIRETSIDIFRNHPKARIMQIDYAALRDLFDLPEPDIDESEADQLPSNMRLHHRLLSYDTTLKLVVTGKLILEPTGDYMGGCGALHDALNQLTPINPKYQVDLGENQEYRGFYGPKTAEAIKNFQADQGLTPSGETDAVTLVALDGVLSKLCTGSEVTHDGAAKHTNNRWSLALAAASTKGASARTARQDNLPSGVASSHKMARTDLERVLDLRELFRTCGDKFDVPPALLAALASRESRAGNVLDKDGTGDKGHGWGVMQVDNRHHNPRGGPYSIDHIEQATEIFVRFRRQVQEKRPEWEDKDVLKGAVVAYNSGVSNVQTIKRMDVGTTGNDYGNDVIARAQFYMKHLG